MAAEQTVVSPFVVELDLTPTRDLVAGKAVLLQHEPGKRFLVEIFVANSALSRGEIVSTND